VSFLFEFIVLFFPSVLSTKVFFFENPLNNNKVKTLTEWLLHISKRIEVLMIYVLFNTFISLLIYTKMFHIGLTIVSGQLNPAILSIKYLLLSLIISFLTGILGLIIRENFNIKLSVESLTKSLK
jgi:hypothetical protein